MIYKYDVMTGGRLFNIAQKKSIETVARLEHRLPDSPSTNPRQQKRKKGSLGVENDIGEDVMHRQPALVLNKARFLECIQEGTDAWTYMVPNHVNQHVLANLRMRITSVSSCSQ